MPIQRAPSSACGMVENNPSTPRESQMFANPVTRIDPDLIAPERDALAQWLDYQRATVLKKLDGLDDEQLRRPMVPSQVCLLGLVKHLTAVEHGWFVVN